MKIAIAGKGGVGKSTLAGALSLILGGKGKKVLALDADPDSNLASALGFTQAEQLEIVPVSKQIALIEERTGARVSQYGQMFKLNPVVSDIADKYAVQKNGIHLLVIGAVERGGSGCACPENVLIRSLITDLVLFRNDMLIMDMEAGVEHLGRATVRGVNKLIIVTEPGQRSVDSTNRIIRMSGDIGLTNISIVGNKINNPEDEKFLSDSFPGIKILAFIPYAEELRKTDKAGKSVLDGLSSEVRSIFEDIAESILKN